MSVTVFGGNGFVGTHICEALCEAGVIVQSVSRTGTIPAHLKNQGWANDVSWIKGDGNSISPSLFENQQAVISTVGSPPLPTFSKEAFENQVHNNGHVNANIASVALDAGVKRLIFIGAKIPNVIDKEWFGYAKGKQISLEAAKHFAQASDEHKAMLFQPGGISGTRHSKTGLPIPLHLFMDVGTSILPSQFTKVTDIAKLVTDAIVNESLFTSSFTIIKSEEIPQKAKSL